MEERNMIPFNRPYCSGKELEYIKQAISNSYIAGNGIFTHKCHELIESLHGFRKVLLTSSCTDALEMAAILTGVGPGDEVIVPEYTFVSTALAFARQGAEIVFADSRPDHPGVDEESIEKLITDKTRVIVPVHYGGRVCDMDRIMEIAGRHGLLVVEDAAHAFGSRYKGRPAGTIGHLGCFSFHETKVIHCGEGGMLSVNDERFIPRAEVIWEKGTDRCAFRRGEVPFYVWRDTGSSFLMSELNAAFLLGQLENAENIIAERQFLWQLYYSLLEDLEIRKYIKLPPLPAVGEFNYYSFYIILKDQEEMEELKEFLYNHGIQAVTHYTSLAMSPYSSGRGWNKSYERLRNSRLYQGTLLRLPLYNGLKKDEVNMIADRIISFFYE